MIGYERDRRCRQLTVEVVTTSGRAAAIEFRFAGDAIEVWRDRRRTAVFAGGVLCRWLTAPALPLTADGVTFSLDRAVDHDGRIALSLCDVRTWTLSPTEQADLLKHVASPGAK